MRRWTQTLHRSLALLAIGSLGIAAGCAESSKSSSPSDLPLSEQISSGITLAPFPTCENLESHLKAEAKQYIEWQQASFTKGGWGAPGGGVNFGQEEMGSGAADGNGPSGGTPAPAAPGEATSGQSGGGTANGDSDSGKDVVGTNNQEAGVDEADIVKTDGAFIYVLRSSTLLILDAFPADQAHVVSSIAVGGYPQQMFVRDDIAVVFSSIWQGLAPEGVDLFQNNSGDQGPSTWLSQEATKITVIDISDRANPSVVRETIAQGGYVNGRLVGSTARAVVRTDISLPSYYYYGGGWGTPTPGVGWADAGTSSSSTEPSPTEPWEEEREEDDAPDKADRAAEAMPAPGNDNWEEQYQAEMAEWKTKMMEAIDAATLDQLVPHVWEAVNPGDPNTTYTKAPMTACGQVFKQSVSGGLGYLNVLSIDLDEPSDTLPAVSLIGKGHLVYASAGGLFIASDIWDNWFAMMPQEETSDDWQVTAIHRFDTSQQGAGAVYTASGQVPGHILNQFSLSEHNGHLRVASTREMWMSGNQSENFVTVLSSTGSKLEKVGEITGIAPGERIYSARFFGDKGYVVTFVQVDPLFTIDLSNPANPTIVGELKIPGFSTYIHPLGDNHLLTIGQETEDMGDWVQMRGMKLEIFDVTDFANPKAGPKFVFEGGHYSEALYEHKAFNYHPGKGLLAIPVNGYGNSGWGGVAVGGAEPAEGGGSSAGTPAPPPAEEPSDEKPSDESSPGTDPDERQGEWEGEWVEPDYKVGVGVFTIDPVAGIAEKGFVDHKGFTDQWGYHWNNQVRRTVFIDNWMYSVGNLGLKVNATNDLTEVASVPFPTDNGPQYDWGQTDGGGSSGGGTGGWSPDGEDGWAEEGSSGEKDEVPPAPMP